MKIIRRINAIRLNPIIIHWLTKKPELEPTIQIYNTSSPENPTLPLFLSKVITYLWNSVSPINKIELSSERLFRQTSQLPLEILVTQEDEGNCTCTPGNKNLSTGIGLAEQEHVKQFTFADLLHPFKYVDLIQLQRLGLRQNKLVPESIRAAETEQEVRSVSSAQTPTTCNCQPCDVVTLLYNVEFTTCTGIQLQYRLDCVEVEPSCNAKTLVFIWPAWQATSRKLGWLVQPRPTNPSTGPMPDMPVSWLANRMLYRTLIRGCTVMLSVPYIPETEEQSAYETVPALELICNEEDLLAINPFNFVVLSGIHCTQLPVSTWKQKF